MPSRTLFQVFNILCERASICHSGEWGFLRPKVTEWQKSDAPLFLCVERLEL